MALDPVESHRFPYIPLAVTVASQTFHVEAFIDTGFDGSVVLPANLLDEQLSKGHATWFLADGSSLFVPVFDAIVQIGRLLAVPAEIICVGSEPLIGRGLTDRYRLILDHGLRVIIEP